MSAVYDRFDLAMTKAFGDAHRKLTAAADVRLGPLGVRIALPSEQFASRYLRSVVRTTLDRVDLDVVVLRPEDADFSDLVPVPATQPRAMIDDAYIAIWQVDAASILYVLDRRRQRGIVWLTQGEASQSELSRPICPLLQATLLDGPWVAVHGGGVGRDGRMLLLIGRGHSGKSTATLACVMAGWNYAGDDYVAVNSETGRIEPLYTSGRLRVDMRGAFPGLLDGTDCGISDEEGDRRHELVLTDMLGARSTGGQLAATLLLERRDAIEPEFARARPSAAFQAMFTCTSLGPYKRVCEKLSAVARLAPLYIAHTGADPKRIPVALSKMLGNI